MLSALKRWRKGFSWALLLSLVLTLAVTDMAMAFPTRVFVDPPSIIDPAMVPETQFSVDITVDQVTRLQSYQFLMFFNPDVLHGVNVENGPFLGSAGGTPTVYPGIGFDNEKGWLYLFIAALDPGLPPPMYPTGGGVLATVTFEVVGIGTSPLTFGIQTGLLNMTGGYEFDEEWCYGLYPVPQYPGGPIDWVEDHPRAQEWQDSLSEGSGYFTNEKFTLSIDSTPITGVEFTVDDVPYETPFSEDLPPGNLTIIIPTEWTVGETEYSFLYWEDDSTNATRIVDLTSNMALTATYIAAGEYKLEIDSAPITSVNFTLDGESYKTPFNETLPAKGYTIEMPTQWTVNETVYGFLDWEDDPTAGPTRTIGLASDVSLTATYAEALYELMIDSTPLTGINFTLDGDPYQTPFSDVLPAGSHTVNMSSRWTVGETVYEFLDWEDDPTAGSTRTIELTSNTSLTARYVESAEYELMIDSTPITGVDFTLDGDSYETPFSEILPVGSYTIEMPTDWTVGENAYNFLGWTDFIPEVQRTVTLTSNTSVTAMYLLGVREYTLEIETTAVNSTPIEGMNFTFDGSLETTPFSSSIKAKKHSIQMPPEWEVGETQYWFVNWTDDGSTNPTRVVDLTTNMSLTAVYSNRSVHNINKDIYYEAIQDAIDDADPDDTIEVYPNKYYEHLTIDKSLKLFGKDPYTTVIDGSGGGDIVYITSDNTTISGFTIQNSGQQGIYLDGYTDVVTGCIISGNIISNCLYDVGLCGNENTFSNNIMHACEYPMWMDESDNNIIYGNIIMSGMYEGGLTLWGSDNNTIYGNTFSNSSVVGLCLWYSYDNAIYHNNFLDNALIKTVKNATSFEENDGWAFPENAYSSDNVYANATVEGANVTYYGYGFTGIEIGDLGIPGHITKVEVGIEAFCPDGDDYIQVQTSWNDGADWTSLFNYTPPISDSNTTVYIDVTDGRTWTWDELSDGNFLVRIFKRTVSEENVTCVDWLPVRVTSVLQAYDDGDNFWDDGYPSGGNHWSDYTGEDEKIGPNQDIHQPFPDGIGDTPYEIPDTSTDHYPLMNPHPMWFDVIWDDLPYQVRIVSNSTITAFKFSQPDKQISYNVTGPDSTTGFCEVKIQKALLDAPPDEWIVLINGTQVTPEVASGAIWNQLYLTYNHSTQLILIEGTIVVDDIPPIANASLTDPLIVDEDTQEVTFDGSASWDDIAIKNYTWTFEENGTQKILVGKSVEHAFETPGFYVVTLEVTDWGDNSDTDIVLITVSDTTDPVADASRTATSVDEDTLLTLDGSASWDNVGIVEYKWYVEDVPTNKTLSGEKKTYGGWVTPGIYNVTLKVLDATGHSDTDTVLITVNDITPPVADASRTTTEVNEDRPFALDASTSSDNVGIVEYVWYVEDVPPQTLYGENRTYWGWVTPGVYNVTLKVSDDAGNWDTDQLNITVLDITKPVADAGPSQIVYEDTLVTLDGSGSWDNDPFHDLNYTWTFLIGTLNITLTGVKPTYNFTSPGDYTVTLNVTDAAGNWDTDKVIIMVRDATTPIAVADVSPSDTLDEGTLITFDGSGSMDNVGIESYTWTFTDGGILQILTGMNANYTFDNPGVYPVTLTVTDGEGKSDTTTIIITVLDITDPVANAGPNQTVNEDTMVTFDGSGSTDNVGIESYVWTFMEGDTLQTLMGANPNYIFVTPGVFVVTLNVTDAAGHSDAAEVQITVRDVTPPVANAGTDQVVDKDTLVILDGSASSDNHPLSITNYTWTFVDVTPQNLSGVVTNYNFTTPGVYVVTLNVTDAVGLWSADTATISVLQGQSPTDSGFLTILDIVLVALAGVAIAIGIASFVRRERKS